MAILVNSQKMSACFSVKYIENVSTSFSGENIRKITWCLSLKLTLLFYASFFADYQGNILIKSKLVPCE